MSIFSSPFISLHSPITVLDLYTFRIKALYKISLTSVDLPLPDTPVTHTNLPSGNLTLIFFKLCSFAPLTSINNPFPFLLVLGTSTFNSPRKYFPVSEFGLFITSCGVPSAIILPPSTPAPGPISTR